MKENGITAALNAGNNIDNLDEQLELSEKYPFIYTAVGVHPHNADEYTSVTAAELIDKSHHKKLSRRSVNAVWTITMITAAGKTSSNCSSNRSKRLRRPAAADYPYPGRR